MVTMVTKNTQKHPKTPAAYYDCIIIIKNKIMYKYANNIHKFNLLLKISCFHYINSN